MKNYPVCNKLIIIKYTPYLYIDLLITDFSQLEDNCIQNFHLVRYIVGYTVKNFVLQQCINLQLYNCRYTSHNENSAYGHSHSNLLFNFFTWKRKYFAPNIRFIGDVKQLC